MKLAVVFAVAATACGKPTPSPAPAHDPKPEHHHEMARELTKFHDALAPRWHAEPGEQRRKDTCAAVAEFHVDAEALVATPAPAGVDAAAWRTGTQELSVAVGALGVACEANDGAAFELAFEHVHHEFHALMGGGKHEASHEHHEHHGM